MGFLKLIFRWILTTFAITVTYYLLPFLEISGDTFIKRAQVAFLAGFVLGLVNLIIKPIVRFLTLPINILTLGLFNIIINAGMLWIADYFIEGFKINGFWGYIWCSILISIINIILTKIFFYEKKESSKKLNDKNEDNDK
jgi:putative membrane protein